MVLEKEIKFILTLDALKNVQRRNFNHDDQRRENSAEHSWQIIVLAQILFPYAKNKEKIDLLRVIKMLSIHDVVEIDVAILLSLMKKRWSANTRGNLPLRREFSVFLKSR